MKKINRDKNTAATPLKHHILHFCGPEKMLFFLLFEEKKLAPLARLPYKKSK